MVEYINNRAALSVRELQCTIPYDTLKQLAHRKQAEIARRGCRNTPAMYFVDTLPYKYRCEVYSRIPNLQASSAAKSFSERLEADGAAMNFFGSFTFADGTHIPNIKIQEYSNNAAVLNGFRNWLDESNSQRIKTSHPRVNKGEFWQEAAKKLDNIDNFPTTLPRNPRRLQAKFNEYLKDGYVALISGKHKNANASKVDTDQKRDLIVALCSLPNGYDNEAVAKAYNKTAQEQGWSSITANTVAKYRKENSLLVDHLRYGNTDFSNTRTMQVSRSKPTGALLLWSLDGWDAELYYQKRNAKGVMTYTNRKVLEVVLDPCCNYPIGYAIGDREDAELIQAALRNAVNHTRELFGQRYRTCQIQSDHFAMKAMTPYYAAVADKITPARVKNAKSKPIERYFRTLNEKYGKMFNNWSGYGIQADRKHQPSAEHHNLIKKSFPDEVELIEQLEAIMAAERAEKREQYLEYWSKTPDAQRLPMSDESFLFLFGKTTGYTNVLEGAGMRVRIEGHRHNYDSFDLRFRDYAHLKWEIRYDSDNKDKVLAVSEDGSLRFLLEEKYVQPMALADRKEEDARQLAKVNRYNEALRGKNQLRFEEVARNVTPLLGGRCYEELDNPDRNNSLSKSLITDSKGQHKLNRAAERKLLNEKTGGDSEIRRERKRKPVLVEVVTENAPAGERRLDTFDLY